MNIWVDVSVFCPAAYGFLVGKFDIEVLPKVNDQLNMLLPRRGEVFRDDPRLVARSINKVPGEGGYFLVELHDLEYPSTAEAEAACNRLIDVYGFILEAFGE